MFLGIFIVLTGVISLLETLNIIPTNIKWGMPLMFTCLGSGKKLKNPQKTVNEECWVPSGSKTED